MLNADVFDKEISELTGSLGDATRRGIYISIREAADPVTASETSELFDIHPNVARHHLDRLVTGGYLQVTRKRPNGRSGPGAGRPAKYYEATQKQVQVQFPGRRYELLSELLAQVLERVAPETAAKAAEEVGREYGAQLALEVGLPDDAGYQGAVEAVAKAMMGAGFHTTVVDGNKLITSLCPFGMTAINHPKFVCRLDEGIVNGLMDAINVKTSASVTPHTALGEDCITEL